MKSEASAAAPEVYGLSVSVHEDPQGGATILEIPPAEAFGTDVRDDDFPVRGAAAA